jgi:MoxR-like ATPase
MPDQRQTNRENERPGNGSPAAVLSVDALRQALLDRSYVADRGLAVALHLSLRLGKPLLLEGEAGVGKTEIAKVLADLSGARLIRLQCYEGLDVNTAVYEWNYARQMLEIRLLEAQGRVDQESLKDVFSAEFLIRRPLLQAIEHNDPVPPVLLIDELDRADAEFEAFLLELLSDFQITIPELGTMRAGAPPAVILTSNRTREVHDALKRRCLYHWIDYPTVEKERQIIGLRVPEAAGVLAGQVSAFVHRLRSMDLYKQPGIAESLDWARALIALDRTVLSETAVDETLGCVLKYEEDLHRIKGGTVRTILAESAAIG